MPSVTGRTPSVVVRVSANRKSLQEKRNENSPAVMMAFLLTGTTIDTNARTRPAPSTRAASTIEGGIPIMDARRMRIANGMQCVESARISPGIELSRPRSLYAAYSAFAMTMPGIICEMRIASSAALIQRKRNWARAYAAGAAIARLKTTAPSEITRLVIRLAPWSAMARSYPAKLGLTGKKEAVRVLPDGCRDAFTIQ